MTHSVHVSTKRLTWSRKPPVAGNQLKMMRTNMSTRKRFKSGQRIVLINLVLPIWSYCSTVFGQRARQSSISPSRIFFRSPSATVTPGGMIRKT